MANYKIEINGLDELRKSFKKAPKKVTPILLKATKKAGALIVRVAKEEAPSKTSNLRRLIELELGNIFARITPTANYSHFVHEGTGIFGSKGAMILPKKAKAMRFQGKGGYVFIKSSKGQPANKFLDRTAKNVQREVNEIFIEAQKEIIKIL